MVELFGRRKTGSKRVPEYYLHRKWLNLLVKLFSITGKGGVIGEAKDKTGIKRLPQYYLHRKWLNVLVKLSNTTGEGRVIWEA